jgi:hypothetical protein
MGTLVTVEDLADLMPGTVLSTTKPGGIEHYGILTGRHLHGQSLTIISASKFRQSVVEELPMHFSLGAPIYEHGVWSDQLWRKTIINARSQLGRPYRLFSKNCEHFVRFCHGLPQESPQLARAIGVAIVGGAILWALAA